MPSNSRTLLEVKDAGLEFLETAECVEVEILFLTKSSDGDEDQAQKRRRESLDQIFKSPNDLIVDTEHMTKLGDPASAATAGLPEIADEPELKRVWDFGTNGTVHHMNYFRQEATIKFFNASLFR